MTTILVIEDEQDILENVRELLELENYSVVTACNGREGVASAIKHRPDIILSDIKMPELDGYGVLLKLRNDPRTSLIPLIFLTAKGDHGARRHGMELGADDFLTKPFDPLELIKAVKARLEKQQTLGKEREAKLDKLRNNIVQAIPHELRTPLTGILGCAEYLMEVEDIPIESIHETAEIIMRSGQRLHKIVENFVVYSQLEVAFSDEERIAKMRAEYIAYPDTIINTVAKSIASQYERTDDLAMTGQEATIGISHDNFQKIICEVLENAFSFSQQGSTITIDSISNNDTYTVTVRDYGRGMTHEDIENIAAYNQFNREFYEQQGLGLGLIIAKRLTEIHAGHFGVESEPDAGTTVTMSFPIMQ